jgi:hypothetical protein
VAQFDKFASKTKRESENKKKSIHIYHHGLYKRDCNNIHIESSSRSNRERERERAKQKKVEQRRVIQIAFYNNNNNNNNNLINILGYYMRVGI